MILMENSKSIFRFRKKNKKNYSWIKNSKKCQIKQSTMQQLLSGGIHLIHKEV